MKPAECNCVYCHPERDADGWQICGCNKRLWVTCPWTPKGARTYCEHYKSRGEKVYTWQDIDGIASATGSPGGAEIYCEHYKPKGEKDEQIPTRP